MLEVNIKSKKAFMKTVEVFIAAMITFTFVIVFIPRDVSVVDDQSSFRLRNLEVDDNFRNCIFASDYTCINSTLDLILGGRFLYDYEIYSNQGEAKSIPGNNVHIYTWLYAGNYTIYDPTIFKLYYWRPRDT